MVRFQRQPPGTAITRGSLVIGAALAAGSGVAIIAGERTLGGAASAAGAVLMLFGGHRANHGEGGPVDRMLTELFDRVWDGCVLGAIAWNARTAEPAIAIGALVALCASFLSSYVRARGAALGYSVEESHVTRGLRYALVSASLLFERLSWCVWAAAGVAVLAALVRTGQVAEEERAA